MMRMYILCSSAVELLRRCLPNTRDSFCTASQYSASASSLPSGASARLGRSDRSAEPSGPASCASPRGRPPSAFLLQLGLELRVARAHQRHRRAAAATSLAYARTARKRGPIVGQSWANPLFATLFVIFYSFLLLLSLLGIPIKLPRNKVGVDHSVVRVPRVCRVTLRLYFISLPSI